MFMTVATTTEIEERHSREAIEAEIARFEERVQKLRNGEISEEQFRPFRLKHGIYGQRQQGVQIAELLGVEGVAAEPRIGGGRRPRRRGAGSHRMEGAG